MIIYLTIFLSLFNANDYEPKVAILLMRNGVR